MASRAIHFVGTTHFDPVWLWRWDEALASIRSTFRAALARMREEPAFVYSFCCPPVFEWVRLADPALFEEIRGRVREGRWHLVEGWWLQPDCNVACGESYARHGLQGQRYLEETFGARSRTAFNTDSFGHSAQLPQLLAKAGIRFYVFGRPSPKEMELPGPLFRWVGPDGSEVLAYRAGGEGANQFSPDVDTQALVAAPGMDALGHDLLLLYGVSNHGGAPTREVIGRIRALANDPATPFETHFSTPERFFYGQPRARLPVVTGELQVRDFGVFANHPGVKRDNRRGEYALLNAERAAVIASLAAPDTVRYPAKTLRACWRDLLFNQFHDIIGGASVAEAYPDARDLHGRVVQTASEILHLSLQRITTDVDTTGEGFALVIWNLNAFEVQTPVEAELQWAWEHEWYRGPLTVVDERGVVTPSQVIQERSVLPGFRSRLVFRARVPSLGYAVYRVLQSEPPAAACVARRPTEHLIETDDLVLELSPDTGGVAAIRDARTRELLAGPCAVPFVRDDQGDTWAFNVTGYGEPLEPFRPVSARLVENGCVRAVLRLVSRFRDSLITQDLRIYSGERSVEGSWTADWRERHTVLKLRFDTALADARLVSSIPFGSIERPADGREMPTGEWLDLSTPTRGVSLISDGFFAYDAQGSVLSPTVLRSPIQGHLTWKDPIDPAADHAWLGQGRHEGSWGLVFHDGSWVRAGLPPRAAAFNNPPLVIDEGSHPGPGARRRSFLTVAGETVLLTALKGSEDGEDVVVRLHEYGGSPTTARVTLDPPGAHFETSCAPHEIKTQRLLRGEGWRAVETNLLEEV